VLTKIKIGSKFILTNLGFFSPYELNFAITYRCNSRCRICNIWKKRPVNELSLKEIEKMTEKLGFIHWVRLTGGEPFLRSDYVDIVKSFDKNLDIYLLTTPTNGLLTEMIFEKVKSVLKFFHSRYIISVSLDGPERIHDRIRRMNGCWKNAVSTFKKLKTLEKKYKNFKVYFGYTISPYNLGMFEKTVNEMKKAIPEITADDFHVNLFQTSEIYYAINVSLKRLYFKKTIEELDKILEMKKKKIKPIDLIERKYLKLAKKYLKTRKMPLDCNIFNLSCFVDPYGNVYPCTVFNRKLGNMRDFDYNLKKILTSEKAKEVKEEIIQNKCPQCWTPCEAHQMILSNWLKI
jgi:MoaA/NifB/PqqE/SkfB family radical SAM enzyme